MIPLPLFPFMTVTYKSLFEKRVLLLDQKKIKINTKNLNTTTNTTKSTVNTITNNTTISVNGHIRKSTDNITDLSSDDDDDNGLSEKSPIHKKSSVSSMEDLRRYHTLDSNAGSSVVSGANSINHGSDINGIDDFKNNDPAADFKGYHFEKYESMRSIKCQYFLFCVYLFIGYIGCNAWLIINCGDLFCLGFKTQIMIYVSIGFVFIAIIIYSPCVLKRVLNRSQLVLIGEEFGNDNWLWM